MRSTSYRSLPCCLALLAFSANASALQNVAARVAIVEPTYLPGAVAFWLDAGTSLCVAGRQLLWSKADQSNNKAVYATLVAALVSGKKVRVYFNDDDSACTPQYIHLMNE